MSAKSQCDSDFQSNERDSLLDDDLERRDQDVRQYEFLDFLDQLEDISNKTYQRE